ncbi:UNVERIFIED_ORG: hypothetical protein ABIB19_002935 [Arthrobacter sp. UYEF10]
MIRTIDDGLSYLVKVNDASVLDEYLNSAVDLAASILEHPSPDLGQVKWRLRRCAAATRVHRNGRSVSCCGAMHAPPARACIRPPDGLWTAASPCKAVRSKPFYGGCLMLNRPRAHIAAQERVALLR